MGKIARSWQLAKSSARVLASTPGLLILPIPGLVGAAGAAAAIYFGIVEPLGLQSIFSDQASDQAESEALKIEHGAVLFLFYVCTSFVLTFFNVALAAAALKAIRHQPGGVGAGIAAAAGKLWPILGFSAAVAFLGLIRRFLSQRGGVAGGIASGALGIAAGVATFLVTPVIASEEVGPFAAIRRSAELLRATWGENIVGSTGFSLLSVLSVFALVAIGAGGAVAIFAIDPSQTLGVIWLAVIGALLVVLVVTWSTLGGIYKASLYAYAMDGAVPEGFAPDQIEHAFRKKGAAAAQPA